MDSYVKNPKTGRFKKCQSFSAKELMQIAKLLGQLEDRKYTKAELCDFIDDSLPVLRAAKKRRKDKKRKPRSRPRSASKPKSRSRSRTRSRSASKPKSRSRSRTRSKSASKPKSRSRSRTPAKPKSRSRSRTRSRSASKSRSRSKSALVSFDIAQFGDDPAAETAQEEFADDLKQQGLLKALKRLNGKNWFYEINDYEGSEPEYLKVGEGSAEQKKYFSNLVDQLDNREMSYNGGTINLVQM